MRGRVAVVSVLVAVLVLAAASAAEAVVVERGLRCVGLNAFRCGWMNMDTTNNRVRGYADIHDHTLHQDAQVQISKVRLYRTSNPEGGSWTEVAVGGASGWAYDYDVDSTGLATCYAGHWYRVDYRWYFRDGPHEPVQTGVNSSETVRLTC
jgi:hypothetical protein